jgi:WXXGXW repeat (2 copies)
MRFVNAIRLLAILAMLFAGLALSGTARAQVAVEFSVGFAPPPLPVYEQPICPGEGYIWTPGYWAWDDDDRDYYWVPGTWVLAPQVGYLWTPGYWGWGGEAYVFHVGYWGPVVGFYGGIDYGWGYTGRGYYGGRWDHDHFYYNRTVNNINVTEIHNVYETRVENHVNVTRVSYNGGNGGVNVRQTPQEEVAARERHIGPVAVQNQHIQAARGNRELRASANHGKPPIAATARPAAFSGGGVVPARAGGNYNPPANRGGNSNRGSNAANRPANESRAANENRPANNRAENNNPNRPPNASNHGATNNNRAETNNRTTYSHSNQVPKHSAPQAEANANQKYQQQQEKLVQKQNQEHEKLQQQQEKEHQRGQQSANAARQQQMEQHHQQQTQQMEQKHQQQTQKMEQRQQPRQQATPRQQASPRQNEEKKPPH